MTIGQLFRYLCTYDYDTLFDIMELVRDLFFEGAKIRR